jgi:hypothetical protein
MKALELLILFSKSSPLKLMEYLKLQYREKPSDNLLIKLSKKYSLGTYQMQS